MNYELEKYFAKGLELIAGAFKSSASDIDWDRVDYEVQRDKDYEAMEEVGEEPDWTLVD